MADNIILNNHSDDAQQKRYIAENLMPRIFQDIPINVLNSGHFGIINEYMSQCIEQLGFTSTFFHNEAFITKAIMPDSIYAEAAIFNLGYAWSTPSRCKFCFQLRIDDLRRNGTLIGRNRYEFILDKDTQFNLRNGNTYSLDHDILITWENVPTNHRDIATEAWHAQYTNIEQNFVSIMRHRHILYRVTDIWLCLYVEASEYVREVHRVINNQSNGIPNQDTIIRNENHICGFDIKYIDPNGNEQWLDHSNILPIHSTIENIEPYVHYIMDDPHTIRFMWGLGGRRRFIPALNSRFEITLYSGSGEAANFGVFKRGGLHDEEPFVITNSQRFPNNAGVMKACFVIAPSKGGTDIQSVQTTRRQTIEAYNTAHIISSDNDILQWFKTLFFLRVLYPFFFKRRDDPWGRIWSGYLALRDEDEHVFRTNTLHADISYAQLYENNEDSIFGVNEIIIPPGWIWIYKPGNRFTLVPYSPQENGIIETAKTLSTIDEKFIFSNPWGIRIQKDPFAIGYFNPWINDRDLTLSHAPGWESGQLLDSEGINEDISSIYHAVPIGGSIVRTYENNYYRVGIRIIPTIHSWQSPDGDVQPLVKFLRANAVQPVFADSTWRYFRQPLDMFASNIPMIPLTHERTHIPFDPENTYFAVRTITNAGDGRMALQDVWIEDETQGTVSQGAGERIYIPITGNISMLWGMANIWTSTLAEPVGVSGPNNIVIVPNVNLDRDSNLTFLQEDISSMYYTFRLREDADRKIAQIRIPARIMTRTSTRKFGTDTLWIVGRPNEVVEGINISWVGNEREFTHYRIEQSARVYFPFDPDRNPETGDFLIDSAGMYIFTFGHRKEPGWAILYADMKPGQEAGAIDYWRVKFADLMRDQAMFFVGNELLPKHENNMRIVLHAFNRGHEVGHVEMQPVSRNSDESFWFDAIIHPLNQLVDVDDQIHIASTEIGGGSWVPRHPGGDPPQPININATEPDLKVSVLFRSEIPNRNSDITDGDSFKGFRLQDKYVFDNLQLMQQLKEMRSIVDWGDPTTKATPTHVRLYNAFIGLWRANSSVFGLHAVRDFAFNEVNGRPNVMTRDELDQIALDMYLELERLFDPLRQLMLADPDHFGLDPVNPFIPLWELLKSVFDPNNEQEFPWDDPEEIIACVTEHPEIDPNDPEPPPIIEVDWDALLHETDEYLPNVENIFRFWNVHGGLVIQQVPFVQHSLMTSERFERFISVVSNVHRTIEPVIFHRIEGNNFLDVKLIATYGLPHTYVAGLHRKDPDMYWPDLNIQIEFDIRVENPGLVSNTVHELRQIVQAYFARMTTIHTPLDMMTMNNNIYISELIDKMKDHRNVQYLYFKGWYTDQKEEPNGSFMDANYQSIQQKWRTLEEFPQHALESFTPEMFVLENENIVINIIQD